MSMTGLDFGQRVRAALKARGVSIRAASRAINYDHALLVRVLSGKQAPSVDFAAALDTYLGAEGTLTELARAMDADDYGRVDRVLDNPGRLDARTVEALANSLTAQRKLDDVLGPRPLITPTEATTAMYTGILKDTRGPYRDRLAEVVAEMVQFTGWLHASARNDTRALLLLIDAADMARDIGSGHLLAQARNFRGYVARQQGRFDDAAKWFGAAYRTAGAHPAQRMGDASQSAQGLAKMGDVGGARRLLDEAAALSDDANDVPPRTAYWLRGDFQRLNLGLAHLSLGDHSLAADHLSAGLSGLPDDQQGAQWTAEYRDALRTAESA